MTKVGWRRPFFCLRDRLHTFVVRTVVVDGYPSRRLQSSNERTPWVAGEPHRRVLSIWSSREEDSFQAIPCSRIRAHGYGLHGQYPGGRHSQKFYIRIGDDRKHYTNFFPNRKNVPFPLKVIQCYTFFYKQPHFRVEPRVAIKILKMRLKVA